jgi:hypothetical protein
MTPRSVLFPVVLSFLRTDRVEPMCGGLHPPAQFGPAWIARKRSNKPRRKLAGSRLFGVHRVYLLPGTKGWQN